MLSLSQLVGPDPKSTLPTLPKNLLDGSLPQQKYPTFNCQQPTSADKYNNVTAGSSGFRAKQDDGTNCRHKCRCLDLDTSLWVYTKTRKIANSQAQSNAAWDLDMVPREW